MRRVLVIGDAIADVYRDCIFKKMCPEEPCAPAVVETARQVLPGGAANVAVNLAALSPGTTVDLIAVLDASLARAIKFSSRSTVDMTMAVEGDPLVKERVVCEGEISVRVDNALRVKAYHAERIAVQLRQYLSEHEPDLILLSDYGSGTVDYTASALLLRHRERLIVDTKMIDLSSFGADGMRSLACKLNVHEWKSVLGMDHAPERHFCTFIVTHGSAGVDVISQEGRAGTTTTHTLRIKGHSVDAVDVNGCGDTFLAGFAAGLLRMGDHVSAVEFANAAAATVVSKRRTAIADLGMTLGMLGMGNEASTRGTCGDHRDSPARSV